MYKAILFIPFIKYSFLNNFMNEIIIFISILQAIREQLFKIKIRRNVAVQSLNPPFKVIAPDILHSVFEIAFNIKT